MSNTYIPLYRKYRPQTFHDLIGQENIVNALSNAIELKRIAHAYLLCGPRGTGKTSSARILAKSLNCKEGPTLTPCGKCPACLDVMNSIPVDVIEIDAASNRSVEDTQAILEKIQYVPVNGRYKIYVIDEVHMLSRHAFNALLKTLEEPPENVIFILATTEPHKVLDTIISRCQRFDFRRITTDDISKRLKYISEKENINISDEAIRLIAKNSQGGMRDALALLDQISVLGINKQITPEDINEILGKISYDILSEMTNYIINSDCQNSVSFIEKIYSKGNEPVQILSNLTQYFRDLMMVKNCENKELIYSLTQINERTYDNSKSQADKFSLSEIIQIIERLAYYSTQIQCNVNKYLWLELCIIDLTNYKNLPSADNLLKRIEELEQKLAGGNFATQTQPISIPRPAVVEKVVNSTGTANSTTAVNNKQTLHTAPQREIQPQKTQPAETSPTIVKPSETSDLHTLWVSIIQSIDSPPNRSFYSNLARPVEISNEKVVIAFSKEMFVKQAREGAKHQAIVNAVSKYLGTKNTIIEIITSDNIDLSKKITVPQAPKKQEEEKSIQQREEEEYHNFEQSKNEEKKKEQPVIDASSQAAMVKELFNGKYIV